MKEAEMQNPNMLGHYHRDIVKAEKGNGYYFTLTLSCGHQTSMSRAAYFKYGNHATLCVKCSEVK